MSTLSVEPWLEKSWKRKGVKRKVWEIRKRKWKKFCNWRKREECGVRRNQWGGELENYNCKFRRKWRSWGKFRRAKFWAFWKRKKERGDEDQVKKKKGRESWNRWSKKKKERKKKNLLFQKKVTRTRKCGRKIQQKGLREPWKGT